MKIGIIGNMNNSYFSLARYLRDEGLDCELLIFPDEPLHFSPACDTYTDNYLKWCRFITWGDPAGFLTLDFSVVEKDLAPYSFLIGNGTAPAFVSRVGRQLDLFIPYGFDIYALPYVRLVHPRRQLAYTAMARHQLKGIRATPNLLFDRTNKAFEKALGRLRYTGNRIVSPAPMLYHKEYRADAVAHELEHQPAIKQLKTEGCFFVVQHTRQLWKTRTDRWSHKGNDILLKGFAQWVTGNAVNAKLVLFEYGTDVEASRQLVARLGIESKVLWMPKMGRNKLMAVVAAADLVVGELKFSWLTYGVAMEALCLKKPLLHYRVDAEFSADYTSLYPMLNASSVGEVATAIDKVYKNRDLATAIGDGGHQWFLQQCVQRPVGIITQLIRRKMAAEYVESAA